MYNTLKQIREHLLSQEFPSNSTPTLTNSRRGFEVGRGGRGAHTYNVQHHLATKFVQHLLVNFYIARRPRRSLASTPALNANPTPWEGSRSAGLVLRLRRVLSGVLPQRSAQRSISTNQTAALHEENYKVVLPSRPISMEVGFCHESLQDVYQDWDFFENSWRQHTLATAPTTPTRNPKPDHN